MIFIIQRDHIKMDLNEKTKAYCEMSTKGTSKAILYTNCLVILRKEFTIHNKDDKGSRYCDT